MRVCENVGLVSTATAARLANEISNLKAELHQLEVEEERTQRVKAQQAELEAHKQRLRKQKEDDERVQEMIELRKLQEEHRKERLRKQRLQVRRQEAAKLDAEKARQQMQWERAGGEPWILREKLAKRKREIEEANLQCMAAQDTRATAVRADLAATLRDMRKELSDLGRDDWARRVRMEAAKLQHETDMQQEAAAREKEASEGSRQTTRAACLRSAAVTSLELMALRDELTLLEKEEELANEARARPETPPADRTEPPPGNPSTPPGEPGSPNALASPADDPQAAQLNELERWDYVFKRQAAQAEIAADMAALREAAGGAAVPERVAEGLRAIDCVQKSHVDRVHAEEAAAAAAELESGELRDLRELARMAGRDAPAEETLRMALERERGGAAAGGDVEGLVGVLRYSARLNAVYAQMHADEIDESKRRIDKLRGEVAGWKVRDEVLQQEAATEREKCERNLRQADADRARADDESLAEGRCRRRDEWRRATERATHLVRSEAGRARSSLQQLLSEEAECQRLQAARSADAARKQLLRAETRLLEQGLVARRCEEDREALQSAAAVLEAELQAQAAAAADARARLENSSAVKIQSLKHVRDARHEADLRRRASREEEGESTSTTAAIVLQSAYRRKSSKSAVEQRRAEVLDHRRQRARDILLRLEEEESRAENAVVGAELLDEMQKLKEQSTVEEQKMASEGSATAASSEEREEQPAGPVRHRGEVGSDDALSELENRVNWLQGKLDDERRYHAARERERIEAAEAAKNREIDLLAAERRLQEQQIGELTQLLSDHATLVAALQTQLDEATRYGPFEADWERGRAAARIQAVYRGGRTRTDSVGAKSRKSTALRAVVYNEAAYVIQGMVRTRLARRLRRQLQAARAADGAGDVRHDAATNIQKIVRANAVREELVRTEALRAETANQGSMEGGDHPSSASAARNEESSPKDTRREDPDEHDGSSPPKAAAAHQEREACAPAAEQPSPQPAAKIESQDTESDQPTVPPSQAEEHMPTECDDQQADAHPAGDAPSPSACTALRQDQLPENLVETPSTHGGSSTAVVRDLREQVAACPSGDEPSPAAISSHQEQSPTNPVEPGRIYARPSVDENPSEQVADRPFDDPPLPIASVGSHPEQSPIARGIDKTPRDTARLPTPEERASAATLIPDTRVPDNVAPDAIVPAIAPGTTAPGIDPKPKELPPHSNPEAQASEPSSSSLSSVSNKDGASITLSTTTPSQQENNSVGQPSRGTAANSPEPNPSSGTNEHTGEDGN
ncbi:hypothetical protein DIPPA_25558 [Diplonema papillatum]|nr:hypothetical protein DIPPA_25558 [Diplonema papillatum]|eukprot:gene15359-23485_t